MERDVAEAPAKPKHEPGENRLTEPWEEPMSEETAMPLTREIYDAFQRVEFDRWDTVIANDVLINSPAGRDLRGLATLKDFATQFTRLAYRIDLVDEHLALDPDGNGRGFITFVLHWKHTEDFGGLAPTGREGTSVETMLLAIDRGKVTRIDVADNTLDLAIYEWERGWPVPHNVRPEPIVEGVDRRPRNDAVPGWGRLGRSPDEHRDRRGSRRVGGNIGAQVAKEGTA